MLVSNTSLTGGTGSRRYLAQSFETHDNDAGYTITDVKIQTASLGASTRSTVVRIRKDDSDEPDMTTSGNVATLTNPDTCTDNAPRTFTAPTGVTVTLDADTTYWLTVNESVLNNRVAFQRNATDTETDTSTFGWSIGDGSLSRSSESSDWTTDASSLIFAVNGTVKTTTTDTDALVSNKSLNPYWPRPVGHLRSGAGVHDRHQRRRLFADQRQIRIRFGD